MNTPSVSGSGSFEALPLAMMLGNGSGTYFGVSQCIPMGPCRLTLRLTLGVVMPLTGIHIRLYPVSYLVTVPLPNLTLVLFNLIRSFALP